ncbi:MAG: NUDIX domain-containing protein [Oscillospiraceae bacterium]|nr:NUDIX domain-containing protein [Oscillospiraceae bacterium]
MNRAQCLIVRDRQILTVKHKEHGREYNCLPGGGIEPGETPEAAADNAFPRRTTESQNAFERLDAEG